MRVNNYTYFFLFLCIFSFSAQAGWAQTAGNSAEQIIVLDVQKSRQQITPVSDNQLLRFHNLVVGKAYSLVVPPDPLLGTCSPDIVLENPATEVLGYDAQARQLLFRANAEMMDFRLHYYCTWDPANPPLHYVSISCVDCQKKKLKDMLQEMAVLEVSPGPSAQALVEDVLIGGNCFDLQNITYSGQADQIGTFTNGLTNVGFASGMIMATGGVGLAPGPNDADNASAGYGISTPDGDLGTLTGGATFDMAAIEFDFSPTQSPLTFEFVFASEEYCEYVNTQFNDVFGFFVSGPGITGNGNIALIPASTTPVAINTVNHLTNSGLYTNNTPASGTLCGQTGSLSQVVNELQYDGLTKKFIATANVTPCQTYHIKLKIADVGDGIFDSAVFLKSGSFDAGGNVSVDFVVNGDPDIDEVYEGCGTVTLVFSRVGGNINIPVSVAFTRTGTATNLVDYSGIPGSVVIPAGQQSVTLTIPITNDGIIEGDETVIITLANPCSCSQPQEILTIHDLLPMQAIGDTTYICGPGIGTASVTVEGGVPPYTFNWAVGGNLDNVTVFAGTSTNYKVTVTDACGQTKVATARIIVRPLPLAQLVAPAPQLCPGQSSFINVNFTGTGPFSIEYTLNGDAQNPINDIIDDPYALEVFNIGLYQITSVTDTFGCVGPGQGALLVTPSTLNLTAAVTNVKCFGQTNGSINTTATGGQGPYTYAWDGPIVPGNVADPVNLPAGVYSLTMTDFFGCSIVQNYTITAPPAITPTFVNVTGPNCSNPSGGSITLSVTGGNPAYNFAWNNGQLTQNPVNLIVGTYTVTIVDNLGCTKTASTTVTGNFTPPIAVADAPDLITCTVPAVGLDGTGSSTGAGYSYNWTGGTIVSGNGTLTPLVSATGPYTIVVTNSANGCTASATVVVQANNTLPIAEAGPGQSITCVASDATLNGAGSSTGSNFVYHWTAGSGGSILSGDSTLTPVVGAPATYTLVVTNTSNGCTRSDFVAVNLNLTPPTAVVAPAPQLTCSAPNIQLNGAGSSTGANFQYSWTSSTGGGLGAGTGTLTPTVTAVGTYTLLVTNTVNGCTSTASTIVTSNASVPVALAAPSGIITCAVPSITLDGTGSTTGNGITYTWSTAGGAISGGQGTLQTTVTAAGQYTLVVTNTTNNCTASFSLMVDDDLTPPIADAGVSQTLICVQPTITLDGSGSSSGSNFNYLWNGPSPGAIVGSNTIITPSVNAPGNYQLVVTNTDNGCTASDQVLILEDANDPVVAIAPPNTLNCAIQQVNLNTNGTSTGPNFVYNWSGPAGLVTPNNQLNATVNAPGVFTLLVTNTDNGCTSSQSVNVPQNIQAPPVDAGPVALINCYNPQVQLGGAGNPSGAGYNFIWTGTGIIAGANTPTPTVNQGGTFVLQVTNTQNGCTSTDNVVVNTDLVNPTADAGLGFQLTCQTNSYTMTANASTGNNFEYVWTTDTGSFLSDTDVLTPTVNGPGTYTLLVTNTTNGCTASDQVVITKAADIPTASTADPATLTCAVGSISLNGAGSSTGNEFVYNWTASNGGFIVNGGNTLNPQVNQPGTYTLAVTNTTNNCTSSSTVQVDQDITPPAINGGPTPTITCSNPVVQLNGSVSSPGTFTYLWTAANNNNIVNGNNTLTPSVNAGGFYQLLVTNTQNGCSSVASAQVQVNQTPPVALIQAPQTLTCTTTSVTLNANGSSQGNMTYTWTVSNGGNITSQTNPLQPVVNQPGNYNLLVTSTVNGCTQSASVTVPQNIVNPVAEAGTAAQITCAVTSLQLNGAGSSVNQGNQSFSYLWTTGANGNIQQGANTLTPTITAGGTYSLLVTNLGNGCTATDNVVVGTNTQVPSATIANPGSITCTQLQVSLNGPAPSNGVSYTWTTANGNILNGANSNVATVNQSGTYTLNVVNSINGCTNSASVVVTDNIVLPEADAGSPFKLTCAVDEVTLQGSGSTGPNFIYQWTTPTGQILSGANSLTPVVNEPGVYTLLVTNTTTGCKNQDVVNVDIETNIPTGFQVTLEKPGCKDNDGVISIPQVTGGYGPYLYSIDGGNTFVPAFDFENITPGNYNLVIQDLNGCEVTKTLSVPKAPDPGVSIIPDLNLVLGDSVTLSASLPAGYPIGLIDTVIWTPITGLNFKNSSINSLLNPGVKPFKLTEYTVTVISVDGCQASDKILIRVDNEPHVYIPNAFSPWDDNDYNERFYIQADGDQVVAIQKFQIFDRWGDLVFQNYNFQPNDPSEGWDGRLNDRSLSPAVFVYYAEVKLIDGRIILYKGDVTLVR
jgi:gliding motility-associated-like protein